MKGTEDDPRQCIKSNLDSRSICERKCSQYSWCIAYDYAHVDPVDCSLITNEAGSCPSGYEEYGGPVATSIDQLIGYRHSDYSGCYGKIAGKHKALSKVRYVLLFTELQFIGVLKKVLKSVIY